MYDFHDIPEPDSDTERDHRRNDIILGALIGALGTCLVAAVVMAILQWAAS